MEFKEYCYDCDCYTQLDDNDMYNILIFREDLVCHGCGNVLKDNDVMLREIIYNMYEKTERGS